MIVTFVIVKSGKLCHVDQKSWACRGISVLEICTMCPKKWDSRNLEYLVQL